MNFLSVVTFVVGFTVLCHTDGVQGETCHKNLNMGFILDASGSVGNHWSKEKMFVKKMVDHFGISEDGSRASVMTFSYFARLRIKFKDFTDTASFERAVDKIPLSGYTTRIDRALKLAKTAMFTENAGAGPHLPNLLILLTDGRQTKDKGYEDPAKLAKELRDAGIVVVVVGIGNEISHSEITAIAGSPDRGFFTTNFDKLIDNGFLADVSRKACASVKAVKVPTCHETSAVNVGFVLDSSGSVQNDWPKEKLFVKELAHTIGVSKHGSRASVITFSAEATLDITFKEHVSLASFDKAIDRIKLMGYTTRIDLALELANTKMFHSYHGARRHLPDLLILLTDGEQTKAHGYRDPVKIAKQLRDKGVHLIVIGVGGAVNVQQLNAIAGSKNRVFLAANFDKLVGGEFLHRLKKKSCDTIVQAMKAVEQSFQVAAPVSFEVAPVSCGAHKAATCSACTEGHGRSWCNGDCSWCSGVCQPKQEKCEACHYKGKVYKDGTETLQDCNTCYCSRGKWMCTKKNCPKPTCHYKGVVYKDGAQSKQDCNTCVCYHGKWMCTKMSCHKPTCHYKGKVYKDGAQSKQDCNTCVCYHGKWMCTKMNCHNKPTCHYKGKVYKDGAQSKQDCNTCLCYHGKWMCTKMKCPKPIPIRRAHGLIGRLVHRFRGPVRKIKVCKTAVDIGFLLDSSGSVSRDWPKEKQFVEQIAATFGISEHGSRASVITFSYSARLNIKFKDHTTLTSFNKALDHVHLMGYTTRIDRALKLAQTNMFLKENGARRNLPKVIVLLTDGVQTRSRGFIEPAVIARQLRNAGVQLIVVGVGRQVNQHALVQMAGSADRVFRAANFRKLISTGFIKKLSEKTCHVLE